MKPKVVDGSIAVLQLGPCLDKSPPCCGTEMLDFANHFAEKSSQIISQIIKNRPSNSDDDISYQARSASKKNVLTIVAL